MAFCEATLCSCRKEAFLPECVINTFKRELYRLIKATQHYQSMMLIFPLCAEVENTLRGSQYQETYIYSTDATLSTAKCIYHKSYNLFVCNLIIKEREAHQY